MIGTSRTRKRAFSLDILVSLKIAGNSPKWPGIIAADQLGSIPIPLELANSQRPPKSRRLRKSGGVAAASKPPASGEDAPARRNRSSKLPLVAFLFDLPFGGFLLGGFLFGGCAGSRSSAGRSGFAFPRLLFF